MSDPTEVTIHGPVDLITTISHLLGYEPDDGDVVIVGIRDESIVMIVRTNFDDIPAGREHDAIVAALTDPIRHSRIDAAAVVGYGTDNRIITAIDALLGFLSARGLRIVDALHVIGRWPDPHVPAGTPMERGPNGASNGASDGVPFDLAATAAAATMIIVGSVAQPNREAVAAQFVPVTGTERADMHAATLRARHRFQHLRAGATDPAAAVEGAGRTAAAAIYRQHRGGDQPTDDDAAWLTVLLTDPAVRDHVWHHTHGHRGHLALWADLTRRAEPDLVAAPASLLAFTAWRMGNGVIADIAVQRALDADPEYGMARLLRVALAAGMPPTAMGAHFRTGEDPLAPDGPDAR